MRRMPKPLKSWRRRMIPAGMLLWFLAKRRRAQHARTTRFRHAE